MEELEGATGRFSDWVMNLGGHIYDERLKVVYTQVWLQKDPCPSFLMIVWWLPMAGSIYGLGLG